MEVTPTQNSSNTIRAQFRRRAFWVTVAVYVLLTIGAQYFMSLPLFRTIVEQNQGGFLSGYFATKGGYDVVGAVISNIRSDVFIFQQLPAMLLALTLWRRHKAVAMGILLVAFAILVILLSAILQIIATRRSGY